MNIRNRCPTHGCCHRVWSSREMESTKCKSSSICDNLGEPKMWYLLIAVSAALSGALVSSFSCFRLSTDCAFAWPPPVPCCAVLCCVLYHSVNWQAVVDNSEDAVHRIHRNQVPYQMHHIHSQVCVVVMLKSYISSQPESGTITSTPLCCFRQRLNCSTSHILGTVLVYFVRRHGTCPDARFQLLELCD